MKPAAHLQCSDCGETPILNSVHSSLADEIFGSGRIVMQVTLYCVRCDRLYIVDSPGRHQKQQTLLRVAPR